MRAEKRSVEERRNWKWSDRFRYEKNQAMPGLDFVRKVGSVPLSVIRSFQGSWCLSPVYLMHICVSVSVLCLHTQITKNSDLLQPLLIYCPQRCQSSEISS